MSIESFVEQNKEEFFESFLIPWLNIPSISSDSSKHQDMLKACEALQKELQSSGLETKQLSLTKGYPVVYAERKINPELPTILIYGHYDVQPIKQPELWKTPPFEPKKIGDRLYARGTADDKGQLASHALAMRYFKQNGFPCNIKFLVEGNEEGGDSTFHDLIKENKELLACDAIIISDSETLEEGHPALLTSLKGISVTKLKSKKPESLVELIHRSHDPIKNKTLLEGFYDNILEREIDPKILRKFGKPSKKMGEILIPEEGYSQLHHRWYRPTNSPLFLCYANPNPCIKEKGQTIKIVSKGPKEALHSGGFGGPVQEPALNISHLLSLLKEEGITYEIDYIRYGSRALSTSIQPEGETQITLKEKKDIKKILDKILKKYSLNKKLFTVKNVANREEYLKKGFEKESSKPTAYLSFRLVANQDPEKIYDSLIDLIQKTGQDIEMENSDYGLPFTTDLDNVYCKAVIQGLKQGYGTKEVHLLAEGGSIPITSTLYNTLKVPVIFAGFSSPKDNLHAPNESILIEKGILSGARSVIYALQKIGEIKRK